MSGSWVNHHPGGLVNDHHKFILVHPPHCRRRLNRPRPRRFFRHRDEVALTDHLGGAERRPPAHQHLSLPHKPLEVRARPAHPSGEEDIEPQPDLGRKGGWELDLGQRREGLRHWPDRRS